MLALSSPSVSKSFACYTYGMGDTVYYHATHSGALPFSNNVQTAAGYPDEPHCIFDLIFFSTAMTLGWPVFPITIIHDEVLSVADQIASAWETWEETCEGSDESSMWHRPITNLSAAGLSQLQTSVHTSINSISCLSIDRKASLFRLLTKLISRLATLSELACFTSQETIRKHEHHQETFKKPDVALHF